MTTEHAHLLKQEQISGGSVQSKKRVRIRTDTQEIPAHLPLQHKSLTYPSQRPRSAQTPNTQPLHPIRLRRWRPLSAGGNAVHSSSQRSLSTQAKGDDDGHATGNKIPEPPVKINQGSAESKSKEALTKLERNYKKSRLLRFTYPTQMHNWVGPKPSQVPSILKRSVPRCLQRSNYYARLPQRQACLYAPWKSITLVNKHTFSSFSLPHPRNKKEQEAIEVKAKTTTRTPRHAGLLSDAERGNEPKENIMELTPASDPDEEINENGSYHYVYEESNKCQAKEENDNEDDDAHSVKSNVSEEYERQEILRSNKTDTYNSDGYEEDFDQEEQDRSIRNGRKIDSSKECESISDSEDETESADKKDKSNLGKHSRLSNQGSKGRRDDSVESIEDEMESRKSKESSKKRDSSASEDEIPEESNDENEKSSSKSRRQSSSSEAESVGDENVQDKNSVTSKKSKESTSSKKSRNTSSTSSESEEEMKPSTSRKSSVPSKRSSISSRRSSIASSGKDSFPSKHSYATSRKSSPVNRDDTVSSRKNSVASYGKGSVVSRKDSVSSTKNSITNHRSDSIASPNSYVPSRKNSAVSESSMISEKARSESEGEKKW